MSSKDNKEFGSNIGGSNPIHTSSTTSGSLGSSTGAAPARAKEPDTLHTSINKPESTTTNVVNKVSEVASNIAEKVSNVNLDTVKDTTKEYYNSAINYSKSNPGYTILAGIGVGVLIGYLLTPRRTRIDSTMRCLVNDSLRLVLDRYL